MCTLCHTPCMPRPLVQEVVFGYYHQKCGSDLKAAERATAERLAGWMQQYEESLQVGAAGGRMQGCEGSLQVAAAGGWMSGCEGACRWGPQVDGCRGVRGASRQAHGTPPPERRAGARATHCLRSAPLWSHRRALRTPGRLWLHLASCRLLRPSRKPAANVMIFFPRPMDVSAPSTQASTLRRPPCMRAANTLDWPHNYHFSPPKGPIPHLFHPCFPPMNGPAHSHTHPADQQRPGL